MDNQRHVNRRHRRRRNLPAELKVEIVDCLPVENAVHFLANVPNRLIIHHCAPRVRRILKKINQIVIGSARTLLTPNSHDRIHLFNGHQYTPEMDILLRYGAAHCRSFAIWRRGTIPGFVGYPDDFFVNLIKHYYETKVPAKAIRDLIINLPVENPAPWPAALLQPRAGKINLVKSKVIKAWKRVEYILRNKHNPGIAFTVSIHFRRGAKRYKKMTGFEVYMI